ncbi:MAG: N-succinylglutamate 5-semialdehyde dehydrogenase [Pseudohongiella sp.]|nr:MAG: N-succinylglutamate 5-semialdehyde dehydrogenase [Pseudohongiella sp.]
MSTMSHYIAGTWQDSNGVELRSENPATGAALWTGRSAEAAEVTAAVSAARAAYESWSALDYAQRAEYVARFVAVLEEQRDALAETIHQETGKPRWESKTEIATMIGKAAISERAHTQRTGDQHSEANGVQTRLSHRPIGVFAVLGPYNFPGHLPNGHIIPALLAGNTIVFKPSELTPYFGQQMVRCWAEAGLPAGVVNLVQGGAETGALLAEADGLDGLLFTGSSRTGAVLHKLFAGKPEKMLALEMGGNNPLVIDSVADQAAAAYTIIQSAFISAGQRCTCARRLIVIDSAENRHLVERLLKKTAAIKVGFEDDCFMGPVISNRAADAVEDFVQALLNSGGKSLLAVSRPKQERPLLTPGIIDVSDVSNADDEECFGPLLQLQWVEDLDAAIGVANNTRFGLSAGLLSDSAEAWQSFYARIRAGIVNWNRPITGASGGAPFGGVGASGNYRPGAYYAADYCAYPIASMASEGVSLPATPPPGIEL